MNEISKIICDWKTEVTIVIPVWAETEYLGDCLERVLAQTFSQYTCFCLVDPSCVTSQRLVRQTAETNSSIRLLIKDRQDFGNAICKIIEKTESEYLLFLHPKDALQPVFLETGVKTAAANDAQVILFESGERGEKTGGLRNRFISLRTEVLPPKEPFSPGQVAGNPLQLVRTPTWLTLFRKEFLFKKGLLNTDLVKPNNYCLGRAAICAAERICTVRTPLAFLHETHSSFLDIAPEMALWKEYMIRQGLYQQMWHNYAHTMLQSAVKELKECESPVLLNDTLDYLCSDQFKMLQLLNQPEQRYRYRVSIKNASILSGACRRHEMRFQTQYDGPETLLKQGTSEEPFISVIIPANNTEAYVYECVHSVLSQTLQNIEIICIDDGSSDGSQDILLQLAKEDDRISLYTQENSGAARARNRATAHSKGKYIYWLDSDDLITPTACEKMYQKAEKEDLDLLLVNGTNFYDDRLQEHEKNSRPGQLIFGQYDGIYSGPELFVELQKNRSLFAAPALKLFRRDLIEKNRLCFDERMHFAEDEPFLFESLLTAKRAAFLDETVLKRRLRPESLTTGKMTFEKSYSCLLGFLDEQAILDKLGQNLGKEAYSAAMFRMEWFLKYARTVYAKVDDSERGEMYGLGKDFPLFRSLIDEWYEHYAGQKEAKRQLNQKDKQIAEAEKQRKEIQVRLTEEEKAVAEYRTGLKRKEKQLSEAQEQLNEAQEQLDELQKKWYVKLFGRNTAGRA